MLRFVRKQRQRESEQAGNSASYGIRYRFPYSGGQCSADPSAMNINRGITNITITSKRRDVVYKRTQSDETNQNCLPTAYGVPLSRCCGSVPVKIPESNIALTATRPVPRCCGFVPVKTPASKTALKVTRPVLRGEELLSSSGRMARLPQK